MLRFACYAVLAGMSSLAWASPVPPSSDTEIESPTHGYRVYVDNDPTSPHYYPVLKGVQDMTALDRLGDFEVGRPRGYHAGYSALGFSPSYFSGGERNVFYWDCDDGEDFDCDNGLASLDAIHMPAPTYIDDSAICTRVILGHELFHHVQFNYQQLNDAPSVPSWVLEGQARAMQDKIYTDADTDPSTACVADYLSQVEDYLENPNRPIWSTSYSAALFWTYLMEQYGENHVEPTYGADFVAGWWFGAILPDAPTGSIELTDFAIGASDASQDFTSSFRSFAIANLAKDFDLSGASAAFRARYSYRDEDPNGPVDQDLYAPVAMPAAKTVSNATPDQSFVFGTEHYGAQYFRFDTGDCSNGRTLRLSFSPASNDPFFGLPLTTLGAWAAEFTRGSPSRPVYHYRIIENDWSVSVTQPFNRIDDVYAVTSGMLGPVLGTVRLQCLAPPSEPEFPLVNPNDPMTPGSPLTLTYGELPIDIHDPGEGIVGGLTADAFTVGVGTRNARVLAAVPDGNGHRLALEFPTQTGAGPFPLRVAVGESSTEVPGAVSHVEPLRQVMLVLDTTVSMAQPAQRSRMTATRRGAELLLDALRDGTRLGLVTFAGDSFEPNQDATLRVALGTLNASFRGGVRVAVGDVDASSTNPRSAVADGLLLALQQFVAGGGAVARDIVLVSDGAEDASALAAAVTQLRTQGVSVHAIALGARADQAQLAALARDTGGAYHYVGGTSSEADQDALQAAMLDLSDRIEGRTAVFEQRVPVGPGQTLTIEVPRTQIALLLPAVQAARESARRADTGALAPGALTLNWLGVDAAGNEVPVTGMQRHDGTSHTVFQAEVVPANGYRLRIVTSTAMPPDVITVQFAAVTRGGARLLTGIAPPRHQSARDDVLRIGEGVALHAAAYDASGDLHITSATAEIAGPDGRVHRRVLQPGGTDAAPTGTTASGHYTQMIWTTTTSDTSRGSPSGIADDGSFGGDEGSYAVTLRAQVEGADGSRGELLARRSFHVLQGVNVADADGDGMPDAFESRLACLDPDVPNPTSQDRDGDTLFDVAEYQQGTDPCRSDSDGGGEDDASELAFGTDPQDGSDDRVRHRMFAIVDRSPLDHEGEEALPARALRIVYDMDSTVSRLRLYGGRSDQPAALVFDSGTVQDKHGGHEHAFVHSGLEAGREYCYYARGFDAAGRGSARTPVTCGIARNDSATPWGSIALERNRPRTDSPTVQATFGLYNENHATSSMAIAVGDQPFGAWQPFSTSVNLPYQPSLLLRRLAVAVRFRDADGNESPVYRDAIMVHPTGSLGGVDGSVRFLSAGIGTSYLGGVFVVVADLEGEASTITDASGNFQLVDLRPGAYKVRIGHPGYTTVEVPLTVVAGQTAQIGEVVLGPESALFADGFESP